MNRYEPTLYVRPHIDPRDPADAERYEQKLAEAGITRAPDGRWQAIDPNQYDGFGPIGYGDTPAEAAA
jgi:hypothetical protein